MAALLLDWQVELELSWKLLFRVQPVRKVDSPDPAVGMDLNPQGLHIVCAIRSPCEISQVELDLVPTIIKPHWHCTDERLDPGGGLIVRRSEPPSHIFVVQNLNLKCEILLHVLDDHDKVGKLNPQSFLRVCRASDIGGRNVGADNFEHKTLDVLVGDPFDVAISHLFVPNLKRLGPDTVED